MGDLNEHAKKYNLQTFFPAVNPLAFVFEQGITDPAKIVDFTRNCCCRATSGRKCVRKLIAHIGDASPDTEAFAQRCRDALFVLLTLPEYQLN